MGNRFHTPSPPQRVDRGLRGEQHVRGLRGLATRPARDAVRDVLLMDAEGRDTEAEAESEI